MPLAFSPLPLVGEGLGERGFCFRAFSQDSRRFRAATAARVTFLLRGQEKSNQREGHPGWRLPSIPGRQVREPGPGFSSGHRARAKRHRLPWRCPLRGLLVSASPPPRGPARAGAHRARQKQQQQHPTSTLPCKQGREATAARGLAVAVASARRERAALPGAPMARRAGAGKSAGWPEWIRASFSPAHGGAVEKPRNPHAHPEGRMPRGRAIGVPLSLVTFSRARERK